MKKEIWKDIPGYDGKYQVSNFGQVKSLKYNKERILKPGLNTQGYYICVLNNKTQRIHKLVAIAFLGHIPNGYKEVINHIDNNPLNNHIDNLEILKKEGTVSAQRKNSSIHKNDVGICWDKQMNKWRSKIYINKHIFLGLFTDKQDAIDMYQKALANIHLYDGDTKAFRLALTNLTL